MSKKIQKTWLFWFEEMRESLDKILIIHKESGRDQFFNDFRDHDSVLMNLANIGEAVTHIPDSIKEKYADVEWRKIKDLRNVIAHDYPGVDLAEIWMVMEKDIPILKTQILYILKEEDQS